MIHFIGRKIKAIIIIEFIYSIGIISLFKIDSSSNEPNLITLGAGDNTVNPHIPTFPVEMKLRDEFDLDGDKIDDTLEDQILNVKGQSSNEIKLIIEVQEQGAAPKIG